MVKVEKMILGSVQTNCYILREENSNQVIIVDPADRGDYIFDQLKRKGYEVSAILLTHAHFDHILGCNELRKLTGVKVYAWEEEEDLCTDTHLNVSEDFGVPCTVTVDEFVRDNTVLTFNGIDVKFIGTPGHTKGSSCLYIEKDKLLISGDTLFEGSVGRTDFPTGSWSVLSRSLKEKVLVLPDDTVVYPGHGDSTTIGDEKKYNPYCA